MLPNLVPVERRTPAPSEWTAGHSAALYDPGESDWPLKIHLGAGGIYLRGYLNIDIAGNAARYHPELAEANATDIWNYYGRLEADQDSLLGLPKRRPTYADLIGDLEESYQSWACLPGTVDKLVCVQMLEHLTPVKAGSLLFLIYRLMRHGARFIVSVPDMEGTINMLERGPDEREFAIRHLRGSRRDVHNYHKSWYCRDSLAELLQLYGFEVTHLPNFHIYPALVCRAVKP